MLVAGLRAFSLDEFLSALFHGCYLQTHCLHVCLVPCTQSLLPKLCLCSGNSSEGFRLQLEMVPHALNGIQVGRAMQVGYPLSLPNVLSKFPGMWTCISFYHHA